MELTIIFHQNAVDSSNNVVGKSNSEITEKWNREKKLKKIVVSQEILDH